MENKLIIIAAIPAMGKSTYANKLAQSNQNLVIVCPDTYRKNVTGNESDMSRDGFIWGQLIPEAFKLAKLDGNDAVMDATNCTIKRRKEIIKMGKEAGYSIFECHYFEPNVELAFKRNKSRERFVPESVILNFAQKWEIPTLYEGFSAILDLTNLKSEII